MKAPSPLLGFNNNFKHRGSVYHIQTEDSGLKHPHIITHLFADGGRILKSIKTSYAQFVPEPNYAEIVRSMMKEQHKAMVVALRDGRFDPGGSREVDLPTTEHFGVSTTLGVRKADDAPPSSVPAVAPSVAPSTEASTQASSVPLSEPVVASDAVASVASVVSVGEPRVPSAPRLPRLDVDVLELERSAQAARPSTEPASLRPAPGPASSKTPSSAGPASLRPAAVRYQMTRPASIFAPSKPAAKGSVFGEELISERSLDEVILAYLAEDLEGDKK